MQGAYPLVFQRFPEPVGVIAPARGHEELQRPAPGVGDGMRLGIQPAFRATDQTPALVVGPPFFARRLGAVRCAFR